MTRMLAAAFFALYLAGAGAIGDTPTKNATALASNEVSVGKDLDDAQQETETAADGEDAQGKDDGTLEDEETDADASKEADEVINDIDKDANVEGQDQEDA